MSDISILRSQRLPLLTPVRTLARCSRPLLFAAMFGLTATLAVGSPLALAAPITATPANTADAFAILQPTQQLLDDNADTFTMGVLTDASGHKIKLRLRDGDTQTFKVDDDTVIRDEDGNRKNQDDLQEGDVVIITTSGDDETADLLVDGGANGFRPDGAFDIARRLDERGRWDWHVRPGENAPFDPRAMGGAFRGFRRPLGFGGPENDQPQWHHDGPQNAQPQWQKPGPGPGTPRRFFWNGQR